MGIETRSRKWLLTINNPEVHGFPQDKIFSALEGLTLVYACFCDEVGENGTYHTHVFLQGKNAIRFSTIKNLFPPAHIDVANGTARQNRDYIRKEGRWAKDKKKETNLPETFREVGECPDEHPGRRTDLEDLYQAIKDGMTDDEILETYPRYMFHMDKVQKARQIVLEAHYRKEFRLMEVEYIWGETGSGKTRGIAERFGYENIYRVTDYDHPFDGYAQQNVIVFEEFRSSLKIEDMLKYLEGHPLVLPSRYFNKQACYTKVFLLTNIPFESQYPDIQKHWPQTWLAFKRRVHSIRELNRPKLNSHESASAGLNPLVRRAMSPELCAKMGLTAPGRA